MDVLTEPFGTSTLEWGALQLRLALGVVFVHSGWGKWSRGIDGTGRWMESLGVPFPQLNARMVATLELVGGLLLLVGLFTHWVAIPMTLNMMVAIWAEKFKIGAPFQGSESAQGYELTVVLGAGTAALVPLGAGTFSLDALLN
ncbi:MAG: DoxX family protein [Dehalococcoidia bacterium]|jgi:putative oxidoreductase|nr:DoxX family protein [Dehalococcoidia bacterium]